MYLWIAVPDGETSEAFAERLLDEAGVVVTPGSYLGAVGRGLRPLRARADRGAVRPGGRAARGASCERRARARDRPALGRAARGGRARAPRRSRRPCGCSTRASSRVAEPGRRRLAVVNEWAKKAILLLFRLRELEPIEVGPFEYLDQIPLKRDYAERGVRVVPPAVARYGSFLSPGVVLMPSYVNIGAWVGPRTMVDTWATVGSCAQIGADVHLSGGVGIGGVLEPPQAAPVIVEDGAFIGSRSIVVEGVRIGAGAVLGANVVLTASTPMIDVTGDEPVEHRGYVPPRAVVIPGHAAEGVPRRHVRHPSGADHRRAQRVDRPEDVPERRPARHTPSRSRRASSRRGRSPRPGRRGSRGPSARMTVSVPPGSSTATGLSHQPFATATAAAATALEPDAGVSPAPRSQTPTTDLVPVQHARPAARWCGSGKRDVRLEERTRSVRHRTRRSVAADDRVRVADVNRHEGDGLDVEVELLGLRRPRPAPPRARPGPRASAPRPSARRSARA